ncbi:MAG: hypothetical protein OXG95_11595 [Chloroflexi bacterium]|nr:hypothetical protein [Chloroflexota bacterium]
MGESLGLLNRLGADLVALQECRRPDGHDASVIWRGDYLRQGSAVVSTSAALPIEALEIPLLHSTVVPVVVQASEPFMFVSVWTHPRYHEVAWDAMRSCATEAHRLGVPIVAAGDFNVSPGVGGQERTALRFVERMRDELGLVSAYHHFTGDALGEEASDTHYWLFKQSRPFHIDYCFLPEAWLDRLTGVEVGTFEDWTQSDHRPLTVDLEV